VDPALAVKWASRYMSVTFTESGREFPWEGLNEAGLSVNIMNLAGSSFPPPSNPRLVINTVQWVQYILDTSSNVDEATLKALDTGVRMVDSTFWLVQSGKQLVIQPILDAVPNTLVFKRPEDTKTDTYRHNHVDPLETSQ